MTAIVAIPVKRPNGKPYILMASDSKVVKRSLDGEIIGTNEKCQKIHKIGNRLIAFAGTTLNTFHEDFLNYLKIETSEHMDLKTFTESSAEILLDYLSSAPLEGTEVAIVIGEVRNSIPSVSRIQAKKSQTIIKPYYSRMEKPNFELVVAGFPYTKLVAGKYEYQISGSDTSSASVGKIAVEYLKEIAGIFPEKCNQLIVKEILY